MRKAKPKQPSSQDWLTRRRLVICLFILAILSAAPLVALVLLKSEFKSDLRSELHGYARFVNAYQLGAPSHPPVTILQEQLVANPPATIFLISWPG